MIKKLPLTRPVSPARATVLQRAELALVIGGIAGSAPAEQQHEMAMAVIGNLR